MASHLLGLNNCLAPLSWELWEEAQVSEVFAACQTSGLVLVFLRLVSPQGKDMLDLRNVVHQRWRFRKTACQKSRVSGLERWFSL